MDENKKRLLIHECDFSIRTENVLNLFGLTFLDQIAEKTAGELLLARNVGKKSLVEIRKVLGENGMSLKGDFLAKSPEERKVIENLPNVIREMQNELREFSRKIDIVSKDMELLLSAIQPRTRK